MVFLLGLKIFFLVEAAPNLNPKSLNEEDLSPIISRPCSRNEPCLNYLPLINAPYIFQEDPEMQTPRIQTVREVNSGLMPWRGNPEKLKTLGRTPIPASSLPTRLSKKDVFMSRGWGPGGMPFSVLYLNPHNSRANHGESPASGANPGEPPKSETPIRTSEVTPNSSKNNQSNYRVTLRNGSTGQLRRQYSIIPQLFISYGWGPSGK